MLTEAEEIELMRVETELERPNLDENPVSTALIEAGSSIVALKLHLKAFTSMLWLFARLSLSKNPSLSQSQTKVSNIFIWQTRATQIYLSPSCRLLKVLNWWNIPDC